MKRLAILVAGLVLGVTALVAPITVSAASPTCGSFPQLNLYRDNNRVGLMGFLCPQFTTIGFDDNFGDRVGAFQGPDDNSMDSWKMWNPTSRTWCLAFWTSPNHGGTLFLYTIPPTTGYWYRDDVGVYHDRTSQVEMYERVGSAC